MTPARPRPSLPFTVVPDGGVVHLVAGEDVRYSVRAGAVAPLLADVLRRCDGRTPLAHLLASLSPPEAAAVRGLLDRLASERVLLEGPVESAAAAGRYRAVVEGTGPLADRLAAAAPAGEPLAVLCQDTLDLHAALAFNRRCLRERVPGLWVTTGPGARGYVGPVVLPDAGPCLACLLGHFRRLSPAPRLHDALAAHGAAGGAFVPLPFPAVGLDLLAALAGWKIEQLSRSPLPSAVFRLHALELDTMEVGVHRVFPDPFCRECADARMA